MEFAVFLLPKVEKVGIGVNAFDLTSFCCQTYVNAVSSKVSTVQSDELVLLGSQVNDVTRLQALVDKKKVMVLEATIREALRLDDEEGVECLPNEVIFAELARMGYEKPSTKLTFYKAFFSSQWKFLIHTILQCMSAKRTSWNEFSSSMASVFICLSSGDLSTHTTKYTSPTLTQKVFANMRRVGKGFSGVKTPLFKGMLVAQEVRDEGADVVPGVADNDEGAAERVVSADDDVFPTVDTKPSIPAPTPPTPPPQPSQDIPFTSQRVEHLEMDKIAQDLEITKLKRRVKKLERGNKVKVLKLRRLQKVRTAQRIDTSDDTVMDDVSNQGRMAMDQDPKIDMDHANKVLSMQEDETEPAKVHELDEDVEELKRHLQIVPNEDDDVYTEATPLARKVPVVDYQIIELNNKPYNKIIKADDTHQFKGQRMEATGIMWYADHNVYIYSADFISREETREEIEEEKSRALKRINKTPAKRQKLDEEVEELKRHLQIVPNKYDDVYTEATPLARKVPVVDYQIIELNNKPYNKIIKANDTHQLKATFVLNLASKIGRISS
nr:hypothetical protein [Tanacetum cinerariifolium]